MNDLIYGMTPVNATAAKVVNQSGCNDDPLMTEYESLRKVAMQLHAELTTDKSKTPERKAKAERYGKINERLSEVKKQLGVGYKSSKDVSGWFIEICRRELTKHQFDRIMNEAIKRGCDEHNCVSAVQGELK